MLYILLVWINKSKQKNTLEQDLKPICSRATYILLFVGFLFVYYLILKIGLIFL